MRAKLDVPIFGIRETLQMTALGLTFMLWEFGSVGSWTLIKNEPKNDIIKVWLHAPTQALFARPSRFFSVWFANAIATLLSADYSSDKSKTTTAHTWVINLIECSHLCILEKNFSTCVGEQMENNLRMCLNLMYLLIESHFRMSSSAVKFDVLLHGIVGRPPVSSPQPTSHSCF